MPGLTLILFLVQNPTVTALKLPSARVLHQSEIPDLFFCSFISMIGRCSTRICALFQPSKECSLKIQLTTPFFNQNFCLADMCIPSKEDGRLRCRSVMGTGVRGLEAFILPVHDTQSDSILRYYTYDELGYKSNAYASNDYVCCHIVISRARAWR